MAASPETSDVTARFHHLQSAFEDNFAFFFLNYGLAGGLEITPHLALSNPGASFFLFNIVARFDGSCLPETGVDAAITQTVHKMRCSPSGFCWAVLPSSRPVDIGDRLQKHGLHVSGPGMPVMAFDLSTLSANSPPLPAGYHMMEVNTLADLDRWLSCVFTAYGAHEGSVALLSDLEKRTYGFRFPNYRRFAVVYDGQVVGTSALFAFAGVAGVQCVTTQPVHRRRGIATALTWKAMAEGKGAGFETATLQATEAGFPVYEKMGWITVARYALYRAAASSAAQSDDGDRA